MREGGRTEGRSGRGREEGGLEGGMYRRRERKEMGKGETVGDMGEGKEGRKEGKEGGEREEVGRIKRLIEHRLGIEKPHLPPGEFRRFEAPEAIVLHKPVWEAVSAREPKQSPEVKVKQHQSPPEVGHRLETAPCLRAALAYCPI